MSGIDATVPAGRNSLPAGAELAEGVMVGRYRLVTRLGAGAMGVVWSAEDPQLERTIAIKVVHPMLARSPDASARLLREARAMAKLSHRGVVTVHDAGEVGGRLFLAMELVPGTTLGQMLRARSPAQIADWSRWLAMMIEAGHGLAAAHGKGVLHRDFKPDNVLVDAAGRVCVADFGLATLGHVDDSGSSQPMDLRGVELTTTGAIIGTPMYMSAEQLRGAPIDARADQFAFCVALYEAMYDAKPFAVSAQGIDAIVELIEQVEGGKIAGPPPGSKVPEAIHRAIVRGLAAKPDARWPTLSELLAELARAAGLSTVRESLPRSARRRRVWPFALATLAAGALALVLVMTRGRAPRVVQPELLFGVATHTAMALSPDGTRIVVASDGLEVRELGTHKIWPTPIMDRHEIAHVELDADEVRFSTRSEKGVGHWAYATTGAVRYDPYLDGTWFGHTAAGELVVNEKEVRLVDAGRVVRTRTMPTRIDVLAISPDRRRVAMIDATRFAGELVIWDVAADTLVRSARLESPSALAWIDDATVAYTTGVYASPTLWRASVGPTGFGTSEQVYTQRFGWFGFLAIHAGPEGPVYYAVDMRPSAHTRMIERTATGQTVHDFDTTKTTVALGWLDGHDFLAWVRDTGAVERHSPSERVGRTGIILPSEPANATRAGDILIASLRTVHGREVAAYSLAHSTSSADGSATTPLWRHPDLQAVRCAGDKAKPCFAVIARDEFDQVVSIDPDTGVLGNEILYTGAIEDIAVSTRGDRIHVGDRAPKGIAHIDVHGTVISTTLMFRPLIRSLACSDDRAILVAGTQHTNLYQVGVIEGDRYQMLTETENDILSLVRPSDDGSQVLFLSRTFSPEVIRLQ